MEKSRVFKHGLEDVFMEKKLNIMRMVRSRLK